MKHSWHFRFLADRQSIDGSSAFAGAVAGQSLSIVGSDPTVPTLELVELGLRLSRGFHRQTIWIADAHRDNGKRFVVHADEKLTDFLGLESAIRAGGAIVLDEQAKFFKTRRR